MRFKNEHGIQSPFVDPHLGHLHSMVLADVFHRYHELVTGRAGILCTGTDEHGLKIQKVAESAGEDPLQLCDRVSLTFKVRSQALLVLHRSIILFACILKLRTFRTWLHQQISSRRDLSGQQKQITCKLSNTFG